MNKLKALLLSGSVDLACGLPSLLHKAGFDIDIITSDDRLLKSNFITSCELVFDPKLIPYRASIRNLDYYDFIIVCDDTLLVNILDSNLSIRDKLKLLPVNSQKDFRHIGSKIGLAEILSVAGINFPDSLVANNQTDAIYAAKKLGYPILVKVDFSGGGSGVFECNQDSDFNLIDVKIFDRPVLVQKKINGIELDLSALYRSGKLIDFNYSEIKRVVCNRFGPSALRLYHQIATVDQQIFIALNKIGEALGANGFTNISAIKSFDDNKIYFFEVDMRPNVWVDFGKFIGNDASPKIANWFLNSQTLQYPQEFNNHYPSTMLIPYHLRLSSTDVLFNRYNSRKFIAKEENKMIPKLVYKELFKKKIKRFFRKIRRVPATLWYALHSMISV